MEKLDVNYVAFRTDRMMKMEREDDDGVGFRTKKEKRNVSFVLSSLALVTCLVLFTLVITWLWSVPEMVVRHTGLLKEMADRMETQAKQIAELEATNRELQVQFSSDKSVCQMAAEAGSCTGWKGNWAPRWHFSPQLGKCQQFSYSGCGGNANNFHTVADCEKKCGGGSETSSGSSGSSEEAQQPCALPKDMGPCRSTVQRWYYDLHEGQCKDFTWGGCAGNGNNFATQEKCQEKCHKDLTQPRQSTMPELCSLAPKVGSCRAAFAMFYYDGESKDCKQFIYGGCDGNDNRFETIEECRKTCHVVVY